MLYCVPVKSPYKGIAVVRAVDGSRLYLIPQGDLQRRGGSLYLDRVLGRLLQTERIALARERRERGDYA